MDKTAKVKVKKNAKIWGKSKEKCENKYFEGDSMKQLYRPYDLEPSTGELFSIDGTAVLLNEGDRVSSKKQVDYYYMKLHQTEQQKDYGPFTWMLYNCGQNILPGLTQPTITRLIYTSTYLGYDGFLVTDNGKTMTKAMLKRKLGIGKMNFSTFRSVLRAL